MDNKEILKRFDAVIARAALWNQGDEAIQHVKDQQDLCGAVINNLYPRIYSDGNDLAETISPEKLKLVNRVFEELKGLPSEFTEGVAWTVTAESTVLEACVEVLEVAWQLQEVMSREHAQLPHILQDLDEQARRTLQE